MTQVPSAPPQASQQAGPPPHATQQEGMGRRRRIAVVTPYYRESDEVLLQCHQSVLAQEVSADIVHILVADGVPNAAADAWQAEHIRLPRSHANNGNTPRAVGALLAEAAGSDFIAFLDADNWFHPHHLSGLLALHDASGAEVCCGWRTFHRPDGSLLKVSEVDEDQFNHVDTSCYLIARRAFPVNAVWQQMPDAVAPVCDRVFFKAIRQRRLSVAFSKQRSVAFRTDYPSHYHDEPPPPSGASKPMHIERAYQFMMSVEGVRSCVDRLGFWPV